MTQRRIVFVAPKARQGEHPGGQGTATHTALEYARAKGYQIEILDTTQTSFPALPFRRRAARGIGRLIQLTRLLWGGDVTGVVIFASSGFSFYERVAGSSLCRIFGVRDLFFQRSGFFIDEVARSPWRKTIARQLLRIPHRIGAQGQNWSEFYQSLGVEKHRIKVIRNWLPESIELLSAPKTHLPGNLIHFVFVGWLVPEKGVIELLEAMALLRTTHRFRVTFVGGGTLERILVDKIEENGWGEDVMVTGWKPPVEVIQILDAADVFVLPSHAEGFPNALLEAMARGLPAICTDVGGVSDSLHDAINGFLIPPRDTVSLATAMSRYLLDTDLVEIQSVEALRIVQTNHDRNNNCKMIFEAIGVQ